MRVRRKKKKGSTLVELIAAVAILCIGLEAYTVSLSTSAKIWANDNTRVDTDTLNKTICENLRKKEKAKIEYLYKTYLTAGSKYLNIFIYFDDYTDLVGTGTGTDVRTMYGAIGDETSYSYVSTSALYGSEDIYSYLRGAGSGKKFGADITIEDATTTGYSYTMYKLDVTVWCLEDGKKFQSESSFFIGG